MAVAEEFEHELPQYPPQPTESVFAEAKEEEQPLPRAGNGGGAAADETRSHAEEEAAAALPPEEPVAVSKEAEPKPEPTYPVLTVTERPAHPRRGWWQRAAPSADGTPGEA